MCMSTEGHLWLCLSKLQSQGTMLLSLLRSKAFKFLDWFLAVTLTEPKPHHFPTESFSMRKNMLSYRNDINTCACIFYWKEKCFFSPSRPVKILYSEEFILEKGVGSWISRGSPSFCSLCQHNVDGVCRLYAKNPHIHLAFLSLGIWEGKINSSSIYVIRKAGDHSILRKLQFVY